MKSFLCALVIAVVMVAGSFFYTRHIDKISDELTNGNQLIIELVEKGDFSAAVGVVNQLSDFVADKKAVLAATGNHEEIDKIEIYLAELEQYLKDGVRTDALARCSILDKLFEYMPKNYRLRTENIL